MEGHSSSAKQLCGLKLVIHQRKLSKILLNARHREHTRRLTDLRGGYSDCYRKSVFKVKPVSVAQGIWIRVGAA